MSAEPEEQSELAAPGGRITSERPRAVAIATALGLIGALAFYSFWRWINQTAVWRVDVLTSFPFNAVALLVPLTLWAFAPTHRAIARWLDRIRSPRPMTRRVATVAIALFAAATFYGLAVAQGRPLVPLWHDSNMHMVQAQLIAHGRLWAPPHPLADHMETFHVLVKPVYAAIHFPGTSMLYAPLLMLGVGPAVFSCLVAGAIVGLTYRVVAEAVDGVSAALVVPLLLATAQLRMLATTLVSHHVVLLPALLAFWAYLHWRRRPGGDLRWALVIGGCVGFAAITRPLEAVAYAVAIGAAIASSLRGTPWRRWASTGAAIGLAALPFVTLQLEFNRHVSGEWLLPPYEYYNRLFHPGIGYNATLSPGDVSLPTNLPQKVDYYNDFIVGSMRRAEAKGALDVLMTQRIPTVFAVLSPHPLLLAFWAPALLGVWRRGRAIPVIAAGVYLLLCLPYAIFLTHYAIGIAPMAAMLAVLGVHVIGRASAGGRRRGEVLAVGCFLALTLPALPVLDPKIHDADYGGATTLYANTRLAADVRQPALVLFRYRAWSQPFDPEMDQPHDEPVYTIDALWPEESPVARLQDLGPARNREAYAFFAERDPGRNVYLLDRRSRRLAPLGTVAELLAHGEPPAYFPPAAPP